MEYTIKKMAQLSGVSVRTLRYYDEIDLLKPARINSSGYRIYGTYQVDCLQQIRFYRSLDLRLEEIKMIMTEPTFDFNQALITHHQHLLEKRTYLDQLILTVEKTIRSNEGEITMTNEEKFEVFKQNAVKQNEENYGTEIRKNYGNQCVDDTNKKWMQLSKEQYEAMQSTEKELFDALADVLKTNDLESKAAICVFKKHKEWLHFTVSNYTPSYHLNLSHLYQTDQRFGDYYDSKVGPGAATILAKIIQAYGN